MKKILLIDDSALMRRVISDIINSDGDFIVADEAVNGEAALELLKKNEYDAVVLDVNMPKMDGIELLRRLREEKIRVKVLMASTATAKGAQITMDALELGALDFVHKPEWSFKCRDEAFGKDFLYTLKAVAQGSVETFAKSKVKPAVLWQSDSSKPAARSAVSGGNKLVAIAVSTGGPKSLQKLVPMLPKNLNAPVVIVQHMPAGFTQSLAARMDASSAIEVTEAKDGDMLKKGRVYVAMGGMHLKIVKSGSGSVVRYTDEPHREGVKPCANYMYESLSDSVYDEIVCVVMTGMGADGTEGIANLKRKKNIYCISQDAESCVVYGMPKAVVKAGLSDKEVPLNDIAQEIISQVGVT